MSVRARFAPSPTGHLHIGGARTALYNWLFCRNQKGVFILRIEDTDRERSTEAYTQAIIEAFEWLGLDYDQGPFHQSLRHDRYEHYLQQLIHANHVYRCYCSKERLEKLREDQTKNKQKPRYDGHCRDHQEAVIQNQAFVWRFRTPTVGEVSFTDPVRGEITIQNSELDDLIIARSDGSPTYNFVVVCDDIDMKITHVIRGDDHLNNTPRQLNIFKALLKTPPEYIHIPMIVNSTGQRLSKREGATSVLQFRDEGILPEALLNYLVRLGWSHGDQEIFTQQALIAYFDLKHLNKSPASFDMEKLLWVNQQHLKLISPKVIAERLAHFMQLAGIDMSNGPDVIDIVMQLRERCKTLVEMAEKSRYFYTETVNYAENAAKQFLISKNLAVFELARDQLARLDEWDVVHVHRVINEIVGELKLKMVEVAQPLRVALTGDVQSPSIDQTIYLLGYHKVMTRLAAAVDFIRNTMSAA